MVLAGGEKPTSGHRRMFARLAFCLQAHITLDEAVAWCSLPISHFGRWLCVALRPDDT